MQLLSPDTDSVDYTYYTAISNFAIRRRVRQNFPRATFFFTPSFLSSELPASSFFHRTNEAMCALEARWKAWLAAYSEAKVPTSVLPHFFAGSLLDCTQSIRRAAARISLCVTEALPSYVVLSLCKGRSLLFGRIFCGAHDRRLSQAFWSLL